MIAVDWGSSRLRAYRLDDHGHIIDQRRSDRGVLSSDGRFADELARQIEGWDDELILLCGMIGSRSGWLEAPYVECPGDEREIAKAIVRLKCDQPGLAGRDLRIVPGMIDRNSSAVSDVMRGEETQVLGLLGMLGPGTHTLCLPGTHSKWVQVSDDAIASIHTMMTGETYALFRTHSVLARLMAADDVPLDTESFDAGLARSSHSGGLLHHLFGVRTLGLLGNLSDTQSPSYLSGLLIGHEVREQAARASQVHLIGNDRLQLAYARALKALGVHVHCHSEELAAAGLHRLSRALS
ncbi:2-dehydro-3-deoxygalactonokinase [Lysobacter terrae]